MSASWCQANLTFPSILPVNLFIVNSLTKLAILIRLTIVERLANDCGLPDTIIMTLPWNV